MLRRIVGKAVIGVIKDDIQEAAGPLQSCAGLKSGIETSIHAVKKAWENPKTEAVLLVDADNAFNRLKDICHEYCRWRREPLPQQYLVHQGVWGKRLIDCSVGWQSE